MNVNNMIITDKKELLIGLMADTHVPDRTSKIPKIVIDDFKQKNIDYLFHMGDFTSIKVYDGLIDIFGKEKLIAVIGNMDSDSKLKKFLPEKLEFELFGQRILMIHGMGGPNMIIRRLNKKFDLSNYDIVIFGHTHRPVNEKKDGTLFLNPGTPCPVDNKFTVISSYGYLRISKSKIEPKIIRL